jgi:3-hydroxy-9,10-secoandrosta-1,3,5(10)-triene-9,17-dione monooxygenase
MSVADLRPAAEPGNTPTSDELVARARALAPKLRERAVRAKRDRNIPQESVDEYLAAGLIHTLQPKRWGGYEHDHEVAFNIALELGKSTCGSSAWCLNYSRAVARVAWDATDATDATEADLVHSKFWF